MPFPHAAILGTEVERLPGRNWTKADIVVYRHAGRRIAMKDYSPRRWWVRQTLGRWLIARECCNYRRLEGLAGIATFLGRVNPYALATEWVEGSTPLRDMESTPTAESLGHLERLLKQIHDRGVALGDLHHRDVLLDRDGHVTIVDLATACCTTRDRAERNTLFVRMRDQDTVALARLKQRYWRMDAESALADCTEAALARYRRARRWKARWQRLRSFFQSRHS